MVIGSNTESPTTDVRSIFQPLRITKLHLAQCVTHHLRGSHHPLRLDWILKAFTAAVSVHTDWSLYDAGAIGAAAYAVTNSFIFCQYGLKSVI
jgi:hypothetical protein